MTCSTFQNEALDEVLSLEELGDINGAGLWDWIEKKFGDGDGEHEWKDDYRDEAITAGIWLLKKLKEKLA